MNRVSSILFLCALAFALPAKLSAQTNFNVNDGDVAGLVNAINTANGDSNDDVINLSTNVPAGTGVYTLSAADNATNGLPVIVAGNGHSVTINGNGATIRRDLNGNPPPFRIFPIGNGATVKIDNLTVSNGFVTDAGGGIFNQGNLTLNGCSISANSAVGASSAAGGLAAYGAGVYNTGPLVANDCVFVNNSVTGGSGHSGTSEKGGDGDGAAIYNAAGSLSVTRCTFTNNSANGGPHGSLGGNLGGSFGGSIFNRANGTIANSTFNGNSSTAPSGAISAGGALANYGTLLVQNSTLNANTAVADGGGIFNGSGATLTLSECSVLNNSATAGGGINNSYGAATVKSSTFTGNTGFFGGAIYNNNASSDNTRFTIGNSTLSNNSVTGSSSRGGGIYNGGRIAITNCTFNSNDAVFAGGNVFTGGLSLTIGNTILKVGPSGGSNISRNGSGAPVTSLGHNISSDAGGGFLSGPADMINTDPQLVTATPQDNGGSTKTFALSSSSPAVNTGDDVQAPHRDQRGFFRTGKSDVGAFEYQGGVIGATGIVRSGNDILVSAEVVIGKTYRLERKLNLTDPTWQSISGVQDLIATGNDVETIKDADAINLGHAFYHIILIR